MNRSVRNEVLRFAAQQYGTEAEYLWARTPDTAVLRHRDNKKWYGIIMDIPRSRLGLPSDEIVDVLNVKCDSMMISSLCMEQGFFPGYHMNHDKWLSILLDGTVELEMIFSLLDMSYELTASKKKVGMPTNQDWLIPANPKQYDVEKGFAENGTLWWHQRGHVSVGDMVYIYMAAPVSGILFECQVVETDEHNMRLALRYRFQDKALTLDMMKTCGVGPVRSARKMPHELSLLARKVKEQ